MFPGACRNERTPRRVSNVGNDALAVCQRPPPLHRRAVRSDDDRPPGSCALNVNLQITSKPEVIPVTDSQRRWPEVGFAEIAIDLPEARFWIVSGWPTIQSDLMVAQNEISNGHPVVTASTATPGVPFQVKKRKCGESRRGSDATRVVQAFKHDPEVQVSYCNRAGRAETSASVAASSLASISVAGS